MEFSFNFTKSLVFIFKTTQTLEKGELVKMFSISLIFSNLRADEQ